MTAGRAADRDPFAELDVLPAAPPAPARLMPRYQPLYVEHVSRTARGRLRHLFHSTRPGLSSLCRDTQYVIASDKPQEPRPKCPECWLVALTEIAMALDLLGASEAASAAARAAGRASYETGGAMTD